MGPSGGTSSASPNLPLPLLGPRASPTASLTATAALDRDPLILRALPRSGCAPRPGWCLPSRRVPTESRSSPKATGSPPGTPGPTTSSRSMRVHPSPRPLGVVARCGSHPRIRRLDQFPVGIPGPRHQAPGFDRSDRPRWRRDREHSQQGLAWASGWPPAASGPRGGDHPSIRSDFSRWTLLQTQVPPVGAGTCPSRCPTAPRFATRRISSCASA